MARRKVVLTGAAGHIAGLMLPELRERYKLTLLDIHRTNRKGEKVKDIVTVNLMENNRDSYRQYFCDADAVIHSALVRRDRSEEQYWEESANIDMAYNIYQASLEENVHRVVVISSCRATHYYERLIWSGQMDFVTPEMKTRADSLYGWGKDAIEHLGFIFAVGSIGNKPLENVQIRIGAPRETDVQNCKLGDMSCVHRALGAYLSVRDLVQLVVKSIEAEDIHDRFGVPFQTFYGISNNTHRFWSITNAKRVIGYEPEDDSQVRFADKLAAHIRAAKIRCNKDLFLL